MPPKSKSKPKPKSKPDKKPTKLEKKVDDDHESEDEAEVEEEPDEVEAEEEADNQIPELEVVSEALRERFEYRPVLETVVTYVLPEDRITSEVMTKFEYCEIVSIRAKQIENGGQPFTSVGELTDPIDIAKKEIADKKCPLDVVRGITDKLFERWHVNELAIPYD